MVTLLVFGYLIPKQDLDQETMKMFQENGATIISKPMHYLIGAVMRAYVIDAIKVSDLMTVLPSAKSKYRWAMKDKAEELFLINVKDEEIDENIKFE